MLKKINDNLVLTCDICGETLQDPDECTLLEKASSRGWIAYHSDEPHKKEIKFSGRNSIHLCSMNCEEKLLNGEKSN